jgi:uncharacterized protein
VFIDFFFLLKNQGLPVSFREYLTLLEALEKEVGEKSVDSFYYLSRAILVKHEQHLDKFDQLFGHFFKGMELIEDEQIGHIPEAWLRKNFERFLTEEEKAAIEAMGGMEKLMERFRKLMEEQKERHEGGNKWIGTGGTSPFGAYGYNPEGFRVGQDKSRHRRAVKVWDKREFADLDENAEIETRNIKQALRKLRNITREGMAEELDLEETIRKTSKNAGMLDLHMVPSKANRVKVLVLFDIGGSMDDHIETCNKLFAAARHEFSQMEFYYFHNCVYEFVWKNNQRRYTERIPTTELLHKYNSDYKLIFVGDASMSPYELIMAGGSVEHFNAEPGMVWLNRFKEQFPYMVWLNPENEAYWNYTHSIQMVKEYTGNRMFPTTIEGITAAMKALMDKNLTYQKQ